jgi:hypothetical protein
MDDPNGEYALPPGWCEDGFVTQFWSSFSMHQKMSWLSTHPNPTGNHIYNSLQLHMILCDSM